MRRLGAATHDDEHAATHDDLDRNGLDHNGHDAIADGFRVAVAEAVRFLGATAPNPPVGCVILDHQGQILSVAAHHRAGAPHAEALALSRCREAGSIERAATAIVTLEPCNHTGRTGPCTAALLASPIRTVWIGARDLNPRVAGGGAARLRSAGLDVRWATPDSPAGWDCAALIAPFRLLSGSGRPWITVKQALDAEGSMVPPPGARTFTGPEALHLAHRLRRATDAIITGMGTILADSPHFTVRHVPDHPGRRRFLAVPDRASGLPAAYRAEAESRGFLVRTAPDLASLLSLLAEAGVLWAMVEAGPRLLARIEQDGLWDDWLTVRNEAPDRDRFQVRTRSGITPMRLIEGGSMFSGIIEKLGRVRSVEPGDKAVRIVLETGFEDLVLGESVAVNGVCLTVTEFDTRGMAAFFVSPETLDRTSLGAATEGRRVNLERAVTPSTRLSGHIVQGHVDGTATLASIEAAGGAWILVLDVPEALRRYCVEKGSITLDGISLTINAIQPSAVAGRFALAMMIIPHTWEHTNLGTLAPGASLNVEVDIIAKYVEQLCQRLS